MCSTPAPNAVALVLFDQPVKCDELLSAHEQAASDADESRRRSGAPRISHEELLNDLGISEADLQ